MELTAIVMAISSLLGYGFAILGGWDILLQALLTVMALDILTGIAVAVGPSRSPKTKSGGFSKRVFRKGLVQKGLILAIVAVSVILDTVIGVEVLRDVVIMFYVLEEVISIIENARHLGVPIPAKLVQVLDILEAEVEDEVEDDTTTKKL